MNNDQIVANSDQRKNVTKSQQWPKCHKLWSKVKKLQNLNKDRNITYFYLRSKSYKIWTMTEMSQMLIKTKSYKIWTMTEISHILIKGQKDTKSERWPKYRISWSNVKKLQNLINYQNVPNSDQMLKSYKIWIMTKMSNILIKKKFKNLNNDQNVIYSNFKVTKSEQWQKCQ